MITYIRNLLNPDLEVVQVEGERVVLHSKRKVKPGKAVSVNLPSQGKGQVRLESVRPLNGGGFACVGSIHGSANEVEPSIAAPEGFRQAPRLQCSLRAQSHQLPGFMGLVQDLSQTGARVQVSDQVQVGSSIQLSIQTDLTRISVEARVAWSAQRGRSQWELGLQFVQPEPAEQERLSRAVADLQSQQSASVYHRVLGYRHN